MSPQKKLDKFHTFIYIHKYVRKVNIQRYLLTNPVTNHNRLDVSGPIHSELSNPSLFNPTVSVSQSISVFKELVLKDPNVLAIKKSQNNPHVKAGLKQG